MVPFLVYGYQGRPNRIAQLLPGSMSARRLELARKNEATEYSRRQPVGREPNRRGHLIVFECKDKKKRGARSYLRADSYFHLQETR